MQPDADALGSTLALAEGLRRRGARVLATFPDPFTLPASLGWLPGAEGLVPSSSVPSIPDVFVSLDAASPARLGELAVLLEDAGTSVVIDHHASNPGFGDVALVDGGAPAPGTLDDVGQPPVAAAQRRRPNASPSSMRAAVLSPPLPATAERPQARAARAAISARRPRRAAIPLCRP